MDIDISEKTSPEIRRLLFAGVDCSTYVSMPVKIAEQVVKMPHLDRDLVDWAWNTLAFEIDKGADG